MGNEEFLNGDYVKIKEFLEFNVAFRNVNYLRSLVIDTFATDSPAPFSHRFEFSRAVLDLLVHYMSNNDRESIVCLSGALDGAKLEKESRISHRTLTLYRSAFSRVFALAINDVPASRQLEQPFSEFLGTTLVGLMRNLTRIDDLSWNSQCKKHCKSAFGRLRFKAPADAFRAFRSQAGPSGKYPDRQPRKPRKRKMPCSLEAHRAETQAERGRLRRPRDENYVSSGSGSETHPGLKKGSDNPYVGGIRFPRALTDSQIWDAAGPSGQSGASRSDTRVGDASKLGPSDLCTPRELDHTDSKSGSELLTEIRKRIMESLTAGVSPPGSEHETDRGAAKPSRPARASGNKEKDREKTGRKEPDTESSD